MKASILNRFELGGKTAVVTGAARGRRRLARPVKSFSCAVAAKQPNKDERFLVNPRSARHSS